MVKRILIAFITMVIIGAVAYGLISYGKGYRFNFEEKSLSPTGILSVSSFPEKSSIFINSKLTSATNASLTLNPGWYNVRITKEGYEAWEKKIKIQAEVVTQVDALLIPTNPSLRALTVAGVENPTVAPSSTKVAYIISSDDATVSGTTKSKIGLWVLDLKNGPLGGRYDPKQIFQTSNSYDWKNAQIIWSPDERQLILGFVNHDPKTKTDTISPAFSFSTDVMQTDSVDISPSLSYLLDDWNATNKEKLDNLLMALPVSLQTFFLQNTSDIRFSPDETKILYTATASATLQPVISPPLIGSNTTEEIRKINTGKYYIYDIKEDKNFLISDNKIYPKNSSLIWYNDSKHIIMVDKDTIYIVDYDGTNKKTVYSGPFQDGIVFTLPSGGKLGILTNFNKPQNPPNFYELDLR